jgi:hypothetical protein
VLLSVPVPGRLGPLSSDQLVQVREELSAFLDVPVTRKELDDYHVKTTYKFLGGIAVRLRNGMPLMIQGYRIQLTKEGELFVEEMAMDKKKHERVLLETLLACQGLKLLRRCKRCEKAFVRNNRQEYCTKKCSGLARIQKLRSKQTAKRVSTVLNPNP